MFKGAIVDRRNTLAFSGTANTIILSSTTFVPPVTGFYDIFALGTGGSGGPSNGDGNQAGGGGGASATPVMARSRFMIGGASYTVTIGASSQISGPQFTTILALQGNPGGAPGGGAASNWTDPDDGSTEQASGGGGGGGGTPGFIGGNGGGNGAAGTNGTNGGTPGAGNGGGFNTLVTKLAALGITATAQPGTSGLSSSGNNGGGGGGGGGISVPGRPNAGRGGDGARTGGPSQTAGELGFVIICYRGSAV